MMWEWCTTAVLKVPAGFLLDGVGVANSIDTCEKTCILDNGSFVQNLARQTDQLCAENVPCAALCLRSRVYRK